jgi:zinc/manganese transport system permease protein
MFAHEFIRSAFLAGTAVALVCGLVGHFVVLRVQVFAGDAFSHVAFTGALAAAAAGVDIRLGLFAATVAVALGMGLLGERARADDVVIGSVFAWVLGLGALFLSIFTAGASGSNGTAGVRVLFGSIFGLSAADARLAAAIAVLVALALTAIARPLLFSSIDPAVARAVGVPVRGLGIAFLVLLAIVSAEATQAVGALLLLGLLAAPAGAARLLTNRPWRGLAVSAAIAVAAMWAGLVLSYQISELPPSTAVIALAVLAYGCAGAWAVIASRARQEAPRAGDRSGPPRLMGADG